MVIRYAYLWRREAEAGREEANKDRPCAIVLVVLREGANPVVRVLPINHSPPADPAGALELPVPTKLRLGLDTERSWVVLDEANDFVWPGPDLRPLPGGGPQSTIHGMLPPGFMKVLRERLLARFRMKRTTAVKRTE